MESQASAVDTQTMSIICTEIVGDGLLRTRAPRPDGSQEAGFTQPRAHLLAHLCISRSLSLPLPLSIRADII